MDPRWPETDHLQRHRHELNVLYDYTWVFLLLSIPSVLFEQVQILHMYVRITLHTLSSVFSVYSEDSRLVDSTMDQARAIGTDITTVHVVHVEL